MGIDTQSKRRSVHGYTNTLVLPVADATIGALDREHVTWLYGGISAGIPISTSGIICGVVDVPVHALGGVPVKVKASGFVDTAIWVSTLAKVDKPQGKVSIVTKPTATVEECH